MKPLARVISLLTIVALLGGATSSFAQENTFREVFLDAFYGGAAGALVGLAVAAFAKRPADHLDNLGYGAAAGVLVGAGYGVAQSARALAELDNGRVRIAMPRVLPDVTEYPATRQTIVTWRADILRGTFR
ncbi:MAG TPA: hypothetical protein VF795_03865 [Desulfuromonadaceae bacterium]